MSQDLVLCVNPVSVCGGMKEKRESLKKKEPENELRKTKSICWQI